MSTINALHDAKYLSAEQIASLVKHSTERLNGKVDSLLQFLRKGHLFVTPPGEAHDVLLLEAALLAVIMAQVSVLDPFVRKREIDAIARACERLRLSYADVLALTEDEGEIVKFLEQSDIMTDPSPTTDS